MAKAGCTVALSERWWHHWWSQKGRSWCLSCVSRVNLLGSAVVNGDMTKCTGTLGTYTKCTSVQCTKCTVYQVYSVTSDLVYQVYQVYQCKKWTSVPGSAVSTGDTTSTAKPVCLHATLVAQIGTLSVNTSCTNWNTSCPNLNTRYNGTQGSSYN